jgi:type IV secretory pathway VirB10-like protein
MSDDNALAAADRRAVPAVARPASRLVLPAGIAGIVLLGVITFAALYHPASTSVDHELLAVTSQAPGTSADLPPAPMLAPAEPQAAALPVFVPTVASLVDPVRPAVSTVQRPRPTTPALILDASANNTTAAVDAKVDASGGKLNSNEAFLDRISHAKAETVGTDQLSSTNMVIPQGTIIVGVLETAIDSDLPGLVRAVVSRDVLGFDGTMVLIPRGARLIGQYSNGVALGQSRAFVIWTRLLRSDGVSVQLGSAATDALGTAGLGGKVNSHFLRRFGAATLLSVVTSGLEYLTDRAGSSSTVVVGSSGQANQLASIALQRQIDIAPTIKIAQGTPIRVFVAKDLDFSGSAKAVPTMTRRP